MGLDDFWLQSNNGKKYSLKDLKNIKPEDIAKNPKLQKFIKLFDFDGSGSIEVRNKNGKNEWQSIFTELKQAAVDDDLSNEEFGLYISKKIPNEDLKLEDVNELLDIASGQGNVTQIGDMTITRMNGFVSIKIKPNTTIFAKNVNENGQFSDDDFIEMKTVDSDGKEITVKREEFKTKEGTTQCIVVTRQDSKDESSTTIYGTSSYYMYEIFKSEESLKAMEFYRKGNNEYYVQYTQEGNTITHAKNGDTVDSLIQKFGFKDREEFDRLNPALKGKKYPNVADSIVVPGRYSAKDNKIIEQGTVYGEQYNYIKTVSEAERRKFKEEHLQKLDEDIFNKLNNLKGLELSNENIGLYFSLNSYPQKTQVYIFNIIEKLAKEGKTADEIKTYFLSAPNAPKLTREDGTKVNINLFNEFSIQMHDFVGTQADDTPQSVKGFIQDVIGLDITKGEGKELYDKLSKVGDPYVIMDINEMFSNIYHRTSKEYKDWHSKQVARLNSDGWKSDKSIKTTGEREYLKEYPPISKETALEMYRAVINKMTAQKGETVTTKYDKFIEDNRDVYLREFATLTLFSLHQSGAGNLQGTAAQKDILNPSKYLLEPVGSFYDKKGKEIYEIMMADCYKGNKKFESVLKCYTTGYKQAGVPFDKAKMKHCMEVLQNPKSTEAQKKKALEDAFGYSVVNAAQDLIGVANFVDNVTDMVLMIYGTGLIGKGLGKAVSFASKASTATRATAIITNTAKGISWGERLTQIGLSATNFAIWEGARFTVNYYTNDIEEDFSYGSGLGKRMAGGAAFGTFAGTWGQFVTQPMLKWIFKTPSQEAVTKEATAFVQKQLKGSSKFTSKEVLGAFNAGQQKTMTSLGKEAVGFASELTGFSIYEIGQKLIVGNDSQIRQILQDSKKYKPEEIDDLLKNPEELKKALKEVGCTDDIIRELTEINVGDVALGQLKTLLSFKAVGQIVYMHRAGKLPPSALNFGKEKPLEFEPIKQTGKTMYKVTYPDGTTRTVADMNGVIALSNMHYQDVTLYKPIEKVLAKDGKMELDEGITLQKNTEGYSVTFKDGRKIEAKDLKEVMGRAQAEYTIMGYENELAQKGKVELPDKQVVTFERENNVYKTTMEGGLEVEAPSFKELLQAIQKKTVCQSIEKTFTDDKKAVMLDESTVIVKQEDGTYRMIVIEDGFPKEYFGKSVEEVLDKSAGVTTEHQEKVTPQGMNAEEDALIQEPKIENPIEQRLASANDSESFVAIRDEIKKMPNGEEKTRLMQAYLQKYNAWSADPSRPDIRMQYIPENENHTSNINQQLLNETVDALKQLGASDKQIEEFKANCDDEVLSFVQERLNSPDFSPFADGYLKSLNKYNLALMKKLSSDPNFDVLCLGLVANAAYTPYLAEQIEGTYDNGKDILPGCQRIVQHRAKVEAEAQDPAVIARKQAYENAQKRIMENTTLSKIDVSDLGDWADIREESIQDLIIYCEKNGIKGYQNLLYKCFENREGNRYPAEVIKEKVELALRGLENKLDKSELSRLLSEYDKNDIDTIKKMFDTAIEERRIELQKQAEKELAINNRKNELREKYNNSTISNAIEGILSSEKLPEELLFKIDELLGDTPTEATCKFLLDCIEKIDSKKFNLSEFINNFNSELKLPNLAECQITESWKTEAENCTQRQISSDYLITLTNPKGKPLFNSKMVATIEELAKTNPKAANLIVDKCMKNPDFASPFIVVHLCNAVKTDANLAFSILDMKNNNGSARFDDLQLGGLLSAITENSDLIRETIRLEQLGNVRLRYNTHKMDIRSNDPYKFVNYEIDDLRNEFAIEVGNLLKTKKTVDGREMYHSYWDIQECLYDAIKTNPDVALYYLNKNSSADYRAVFDGRVVKALASMTPRLEKYFRERFESITNDDGYVQTDRIKGEIGPINERNAQLAEKLYLDLNMQPDEVKIIIQNAEYYPIDFFTEETCKILLRIKNDGADLSKTLFALFDESIPQKLPDKIKTLLTLQMLTPEDVQIFKKHGIDVNKKIEIFQNAIDKKHPIIETKPENARAILKALANNGNADEVLQNMDFSMFEQNGIRLQYTREEFMQKMTELIARYQSSFDASLENVEIPALKLSTEQETKTQDRINQLRSEKKIKTYTFVINGKECTVERFLESKPNGSNEGDFALIDGKLYYIKFPSSDKLGQSVEEVIASQLYRAAGVDAPNETYLIDKNGVVRGMASEYVPEMQNLRDKSMLFDSFAVDAWLANWDAPKNDNTQMYGDGNVIKSDVGGALHYRAKGELKLDFGNVVNELVSLIENNPLYANMSKADLLKSLEHVINVPDEAIIKVVKDSPNSDNNLIFTLLKRKEFIQIFTEKVKMLDETKFNNITSLIKEAKRLATKDFEDTPDVAGMLGYTPTKDGFEGLLNTQDLSGKDLTPEQRTIADEMRAEIRRFTVDNRLADDVDVSVETRDFINGILQGVPEFAAYFGKPQHGNGNVDADGRQISGHQYPLDIHILKVLQSSVNDPWYSKTDNDGKRILDDESRIVLKFSALLHDIGKKYLTGRDAGHASLSAEYVYSILDRFNLPTRTKNRIINMVNNHHWLEAYCKGQITDETVATMFRTTEDFTIARIMARADLENVREGFFTKTMMADFPKEVHNSAEANQKFEQIMDQIQSKVDIIEKNQPMIMPSKFVEVPERVTSDGRVIARRGFPIVQKMLDGKMETFKVLNLHDLDPETDMYQYGFGHIKLKDLRLLVHRAGDGNRTNFNTFKLLGANPQNTSLQSLTLIKATDPGTYVGMNWSFIMEGNMSNIGVADYKNAGTGRLKTLEFLVDEFFGNGKKDFKPDDPRRTFFRNNFVDYFKNKGIEVDDKTYATILKYVRNKQYVETQIKDLKIGDKIFKKEDLIEGLIFARDMLIEKKGYTEHNEETMMDCVPVAGGISAESFDHVEDDFLRICRDNCDGKMIIW